MRLRLLAGAAKRTHQGDDPSEGGLARAEAGVEGPGADGLEVRVEEEGGERRRVAHGRDLRGAGAGFQAGSVVAGAVGEGGGARRRRGRACMTGLMYSLPTGDSGKSSGLTGPSKSGASGEARLRGSARSASGIRWRAAPAEEEAVAFGGRRLQAPASTLACRGGARGARALAERAQRGKGHWCPPVLSRRLRVRGVTPPGGARARLDASRLLRADAKG